jgi:glycosyltransferase involved in cell wall biosynthesis
VTRVAVLILAYRQAQTIADAIASIHTQTHPVDELIISDDGSDDGTADVAHQTIEALGVGGPKSSVRQVRVIRQPRNLGFIAHINAAISDIPADLIFYNAGDDVSDPQRVQIMVAAFEAKGCPRHFLGHSSVRILDGITNSLVWTPPISRVHLGIEQLAIATALHIGASQVFTPALFHDFGPIQFEKTYEDLTLGFRALLTDAYHYESKPLLSYRKGGISSWRRNSYRSRLERLRDTLKQRALDCLHANRPELFKEVNAAYQAFGIGLTPSAQRIPVHMHLELNRYPADRGWPSSLAKLDSVLSIEASTPDAGGPSDAVHLHVWDAQSLSAEPAGLPAPSHKAHHLLYVPDQESVDSLARYMAERQGQTTLSEGKSHPLQGLHRVLASSDDLCREVRSLDLPCPVDLAIETVDSDQVLKVNPPAESKGLALLVPWDAWPLAAELQVDAALHQLRTQHPDLRILAFAESDAERRMVDMPLPAPFDGWVTADQITTLSGQIRLIALLWQSPAGNTHHLWGRWALQGIPCVCRNETDFRPWVTQGETGLLVDPLQDKWTMAVNMLLANSKLRIDITEKAQEFAYFNLNLWKKSKHVFQQLIERTEAYSFPHFYPL